jgi:hypothetical protein
LPGRCVEATIDAATQGQKSRMRAPFVSIDKKGGARSAFAVVLRAGQAE